MDFDFDVRGWGRHCCGCFTFWGVGGGGLLIQKVEFIAHCFTFSGCVGVDLKGWGVHCCGCFTFWGGVLVLIRKVEEFFAMIVVLSVGGCVDPKGWGVHCSGFTFCVVVCWSERLRSSLLWLFYFLCGCWSERLSSLLWLLSVGVCWAERLRSSLLWFYFLSVCVDPKGWVYCLLFYFLWVGVDLKGWGVHCSGWPQAATVYRWGGDDRQLRWPPSA